MPEEREPATDSVEAIVDMFMSLLNFKTYNQTTKEHDHELLGSANGT